MSTLTEAQHARLDRLEVATPDARVVALTLNPHGEETPVLRLPDGRYMRLWRSGRLHEL